MTHEELINVFRHIVKKCDMLINNKHYEADNYTQNNVEDIAELCNHILDGDYGKLTEVKEVNFDGAVERYINQHRSELNGYFDIRKIAKHFFELGLIAQKGE